MIETINAHLSNDLGNLAYRCLSFTDKECGKRIPEPGGLTAEASDLTSSFALIRGGGVTHTHTATHARERTHGHMVKRSHSHTVSILCARNRISQFGTWRSTPVQCMPRLQASLTPHSACTQDQQLLGAARNLLPELRLLVDQLALHRITHATVGRVGVEPTRPHPCKAELSPQ